MEEFDLKRFAKLAMAKKIFIIVIMIIAISIGVFYSYFFVTPKYKSTTSLLLAQINEDKMYQNTVKQSDITDLSMTNILLEPYIDLIKSNKVLKKVIQNLKLNMTEDELKRLLSVTEKNTAMIEISVASENAEFSAKVANEIAKVFTEVSQDTLNITNVNIIDDAEVETVPYNVNHLKDLVVFFLLGAFASCGLILVIYMLDTTIKEEEDIEQELKLPVLGVIPKYTKKLEDGVSEKGSVFGKNNKKGKAGDKKKARELVILESAKSPVSEAFRALRTNLTFSPNTKTILITSSSMSEGKSFVTANLAIAIAKTGKKVIIVDADMRKGRQNKIFGLDNKNGLSNYLANAEESKINIEEITSYIKTTEISNLHLLPSGARPTNPAELLTLNKVQGLLSVLKDIYDIVLIDGTPSNIIADCVSIAKFVDYTILVTSHKTTKIEEAKRVIKSFEQVGGKIKGAVLNMYPLTKEEYCYYYSDEKNIRKLQENDDNQIKSVADFVEESNIKENTFKINQIDKDDLDEQQNYESRNNLQIISNERNSALEYKIEKIDNEISAMKDVLMQIAMNNDRINSKDIEIIRYDIKNLKDSIETIKDNSKIDELKREVETTKELAESLVNTQQQNNEKIKKFIENYYKSKSRSNEQL